MRLKFLFVFVVLLSVFSFAQEDFEGYASVNMKLKIDSNIDLVATGPNPETDFLTGELFLYPRDSKYQIISNVNYNVNPDAEIRKTDDKVIYKWINPDTSIYLNYEANVQRNNQIIQIPKKINFPLENLDPNYNQFIEPSEYIVINEDIRNKANEIIAGEDDYYKAVFKLSDWVRTNIQYNLTTLTAEVVQKSSWVLENREGVCDEITNLFISMARSVGIPARFISGVAYTSLSEDWGNHGWAEVYFPDYGWIPVDVTYGQYGYVDASHINLGESKDSSNPSLVISASSRDMDFNAKSLEIDTQLISKGEKLPNLVRVEMDSLYNQVGPGSYVPVKINLKNLQSFYVPIHLRVTKAPGLQDSNIKMILLRPNEEKTVFFTAIMPEDTERDYLYTTVFEVIGSFGGVYSEKIAYGDLYETINKEDVEEDIYSYLEKEESSYSQKIDLTCIPKKPYYFDYEKANIVCEVKNTGNTVLKNMDVCLDDDCRNFDLYISESRQVEFNDLDPNKELRISAKSNNVDVEKYIEINSLNDPNLKIINVDYPDKFSYKEDINLKFLLSSDAPVKNVHFYINGDEVYRQDEFFGDENKIFTVKGKRFYSSDNFANLSIIYEDENNYQYHTSKSFLVSLYNIPFYIKMLAFFNLI